MARQSKKHRGVYEYPADSGVWWIQFFVNGRRRREKIGGKQAAIDRYQQRKTEAREGRLPSPERIVRVDDFILEYLDGEKHARSYITMARHGRRWSHHLKGRSLRSVLPSEVKKWRALRLADGMSEASVNRELSFLRRVFNVAMEDKLVTENPVGRKLFFKEANSRVRFLTEHEETCLREEVDPAEWKVIEFAFNTGLRQGEQFGLRWPQINMAQRVLTIPRSKSGETRHVPLNDTAMTILRSLPTRLHSPFVFTSPEGRALNATNFLNRVFIPAIRSAGIKDFRWHDLRHTFASRLAMKGVDMNAIRELLGHKTMTMTLRYAHLSPAHLHQAVKQLDSGGSSGGSTAAQSGSSRVTHSATKPTKSR